MRREKLGSVAQQVEQCLGNVIKTDIVFLIRFVVAKQQNYNAKYIHTILSYLISWSEVIWGCVFQIYSQINNHMKAFSILGTDLRF